MKKLLLLLTFVVISTGTLKAQEVVKDSIVTLEDVEVVGDAIPTITIGDQTFVMQEVNDEMFGDLLDQKRWLKSGLNRYGINENAQTWALALREHIPTARQTPEGLPILRSSNSINNTRVTPIWVVDGLVMGEPPGDVQAFAHRIKYVKVYSSLAQTTRWGTLGRAGVIVIKTIK